MGRTKTRRDWNAADFTRPTCELAFEYGVTETTVCYHRRKRGINIREDRWRSVDWSQDSRNIADKLGVTYEAVTYQRRKRNQPSMSKIISKICTAGHPSRCTAIRARCECSAPLFTKDSPEGQAIVAAMQSGKKKHHSAGYGGRDNKSGKRQAYRAYGDSETAARV